MVTKLEIEMFHDKSWKHLFRQWRRQAAASQLVT